MSKPNLVRTADHAATPEARWSFSHPFNPASQVAAVALSRMTGLERTAVNLLRIPPRKESFAYHSHACEEEWIYVLAGRGIAEIDGVEHEVGPGDFMGFPAPSIGHHLRNPHDVELVYLAGGEIRAVDISDFPRQGKRIVRVGDAIAVHDLAEAATFGAFPTIDPLR